MNDQEFEEFVADTRPKLRRALVASVGIDRVDDAVAEAFAYAFEHRQHLAEIRNPVGFLFRVGQSRSRLRKRVRLLRDEAVTMPDVEPQLVEALSRLPNSQRVSVWLASGCGWTHAEIGEALGISASTVSTHVSRAMARLRSDLGVVHADT